MISRSSKQEIQRVCTKWISRGNAKRSLKDRHPEFFWWTGRCGLLRRNISKIHACSKKGGSGKPQGKKGPPIPISSIPSLYSSTGQPPRRFQALSRRGSVRSCGHVDRSLPCNERNTVSPSLPPFLSLSLLSLSLSDVCFSLSAYFEKGRHGTKKKTKSEPARTSFRFLEMHHTEENTGQRA